jgi:hypothetical protein
MEQPDEALLAMQEEAAAALNEDPVDVEMREPTEHEVLMS